jgi:hypothetical protein
VIIRRPVLFAFMVIGATVSGFVVGYLLLIVWLAFHPIPFD